MFVEGLSTRKTKVGTFRFGVVYDLSKADFQTRSVAKQLTSGESPALKILSKTEAKKRQAELLSPEKAAAPDPKATAADLRSALATAEAERAEAQKTAEAAEAKVDDLGSKLADAEKALDDANLRIADLVKAAEKK